LPHSASKRRSAASAASGNTAIATTATAEYVGRFAPSPTGSLHLGSLVAALASWLDARCRSGQWLLRIEDLDAARNVAGAGQQFIQTLRNFGLQWDGDVALQSTRLAHYEAALAELAGLNLLFCCDCSRRQISAAGTGEEPRCVGGCRERALPAHGNAIRVALDRCRARRTEDRGGEALHFDPTRHTDVVVRRRDGVFSYQLAVVVDDAAQRVTDVVRGADLLASTSWQLGLQSALQLATPRYLHVPLVTEPGGAKLAKSRRAVPLAAEAASQLLVRSLDLLQQAPTPTLAARPAPDVLEWALAHWNPGAFRGCSSVGA
jgi:glutamyl-Q tRNA(Asp) synthetase